MPCDKSCKDCTGPKDTDCIECREPVAYVKANEATCKICAVANYHWKDHLNICLPACTNTDEYAVGIATDNGTVRTAKCEK
jgi:hypothetical protein